MGWVSSSRLTTRSAWKSWSARVCRTSSDGAIAEYRRIVGFRPTPLVAPTSRIEDGSRALMRMSTIFDQLVVLFLL